MQVFVFDHEFYTREMIENARQRRIAQLQHEIDVLNGEEFRRHIRQYLRYDGLFQRFAATGRYNDADLDRLSDRVQDEQMEIDSLLTRDGWHIPNAETVTFAVINNGPGGTCDSSEACLSCRILTCPNHP